MDKDILGELYSVIEQRKTTKEEGSYTCYLFESGLDKILKKVGEECSETIIAAKNGEGVVPEVSDLIYHLLVMLSACDIPLSEVMGELERRSAKMGNLKKMKVTDKET
ncbi:MAG: phosphoribosyl-ATP diphosphatase [Eubacteriales bacterium]